MPADDSSFFDLRSAPLGLFGGFAQSGSDRISVEARGPSSSLSSPNSLQGPLNSRAVEWAQACSTASERLRQTLGDSALLSEAPARVQITQSSPFAASARVVLEPAVNQALRWVESAPLRALALRARSRDRLLRAEETLAAFHKGPEARRVDGSWRVIIPALNRTDDLMARASRVWSADQARQFLVMHETGHVEHQRAEDAFDAYFGLGQLPARAACALALLAGVSEPVASSPQTFESACSTLMAEGYADVFACLALGEGVASKTIELARQAKGMRLANAGQGDASIAVFDQDPLHDTSEALTALEEALLAGPERLELTPERLRELCSASSAKGLCRWICSLPAQPNLAGLQAAFYAKCEGLARRDEVGQPHGFFETLQAAEAGPLGAALSRLNWAQARRSELDSSESPSDDRSARVALSLMMDLADGVGAPRALPAAIPASEKPASEPLLLARAEPATRFERFLVESLRGARSLTLERRNSQNDGALIPQPLLASRAIDWMSACERASSLWASCPGSPRAAPIQATVTEASIVAPAASFITRAALSMAIELCGAWRQARQFLSGSAPQPLSPSLALPMASLSPSGAEEPQRRFARRLRELLRGPSAHVIPSLYDDRPPEPEAALAPLFDGPRLVFPANRAVEDTLAQIRAHCAQSEQELRVFIALHEASHAMLALQSLTSGDHFGLSLASDATAGAMRALLWPPALPEGELREEAALGMTELFGEFERAARSVFMESHADCLATLTQSQTDAQDCSRRAQSWIVIRAAFIDAHPLLFDSPQGAELTHDTREALNELASLCVSNGPGPLPLPEGGTHELATRCALAGTARWICKMASQEPPGLVTQALRHKLDFLARMSDEPPAPEAPSDLGPPLSGRLIDTDWAEALSRPASAGCGPDHARLAKGIELLGPLHCDFGPPLCEARGSFYNTGAVAPLSPLRAFDQLSQLARNAANSLRSPLSLASRHKRPYPPR